MITYMKIEVNVNKKYFLVLLVCFLIIAGVIIAYALNAGEIPNPGHSINEIGAPASCNAGQFLQWTGNSWKCSTAGCISLTTAQACINGQNCGFAQNGCGGVISCGTCNFNSTECIPGVLKCGYIPSHAYGQCVEGTQNSACSILFSQYIIPPAICNDYTQGCECPVGFTLESNGFLPGTDKVINITCIKKYDGVLTQVF